MPRGVPYSPRRWHQRQHVLSCRPSLSSQRRQEIGSCDAREAFARLVNYLPGAPMRSEFDTRIRSIRNKAAFHNDREMVGAALESRASLVG
jgi:hypothetical protein